jgi:hypothetical protein
MADFDDVQDKARRNLVTLSALILASVYLKPKLAAKGQLFGFIDTTDVEPHRIWVAVTIVLCYFAYRYWHSPARREAWSKWSQDREQHAKAWIEMRIAKAARDYYINKRTSSIVSHLDAEEIGDGSAPRLRDVTAKLTEEGTLPLNSVIITWIFESGRGQHVRAYTHNYTGLRRRLVRAVMLMRVSFFADGTHELLIPFVLAVLALLPCVAGILRA